MKKVKSAVIDSITIPDLSLLLRKNEIVSVPDHIFAASKDLKAAIRKNLVMCEGMAHKGKIVKFHESTMREFVPPEIPDNTELVENRISTLEKSVTILLKNYYETQKPKYDDYHLYMQTFASTDYDALVFDAFHDEEKRNQENPGDIVIKNGLLSNADNSERFSIFNSKTFQVEGDVCSIYPMIRWSGDGVIQMSVTVGDQQIVVLDTGNNVDLLWNPVEIQLADSLSITVGLYSKYNNIYVSSYGILLKLK